MEQKHYIDFFTVPAKYTANMTQEAINETPETWMDFYPHIKYLDFLNTLFDEQKSVWLTGNYGTGKSNAALVTHKLYMDDPDRVHRWFAEYSNVIPNCSNLEKRLFEARARGTLVVYDYNASGVGPHEEFLVRLEKGILAALGEQNMTVPAKANLDLVLERLRREGEHFFYTRDTMLSDMKSLKGDICSVPQLEEKLRQENMGSTPTHFLEDVQAVFHRDDIYLNINVPTFRAWISAICTANHLSRIIYIFDEFSDFIDANSGTLKTFEEVTEAPANNHFYLVPVTHKELSAFYGENSPGANKAKDRFYFRNLQMPNDIAFRLAAHAMKPLDAEKWDQEKKELWNSVVSVVDQFRDLETSEAYVSRQSFYDILPIHPMAAFLLKFLAESARSNQRSIFEYLKGSADGREFQDFIATGGPAVFHRQFLTVDYLWKYFMEREDSGQSKEIVAIRMEYDRIRAREFGHYSDEQPEIRVLKTVLLFSLLSRLNPNGHDRLRPTVENVELSFRGDGVVMDVLGILRDLAENRHCFSIAGGNIDLYATTVGSDDLEKKKNELSSQFHELLSEKCRAEMEAQTKTVRAKFSSGRFDIRVSDGTHTALTNLNTATREKYSSGLGRDDGSVCLWFVVAKNRTEQMQLQEKEARLLENLRGHRIVMVSFPDITFCEKDIKLWDEYVGLYAQYLLENKIEAKNQIKASFERIEKAWTDRLKASNTTLDIRYYDTAAGAIQAERLTWPQINAFLHRYTKSVLDACPDLLTEQITVFGNKALKAWALAGLRFSASAPQSQLIGSLKSQGISQDDAWFTANPTHLFGKIRALLEKKYANTVGKGGQLSLRKAYLELRRAPYGMRYNGLSAFTLGFCTRWLLEKNCQWTNGQLNRPLDDETLAEIIEATVSEKTGNEKWICRLSKEDKTFAERAGELFGLPPAVGATPNDTLRAISGRVEETSCRVPLWVLAHYIRAVHPEHEPAAIVIDALCTALKISSKGNKEEFNAAISDVGGALLRHSDLIATVASYTKESVYISAFRHYVDSANPELASLAVRVEDLSHGYCDMILNQAVSTTGWLWNPLDISALIAAVHDAYRFMELARRFLGLAGYASYGEILSLLERKMATAGFPLAMVGEKYPAIAKLIEMLQGDRNAHTLLEAMEDGAAVLDALYNDPEKKLALAMIAERLGDGKLDRDDLLDLVTQLPLEPDYHAGLSTEKYLALLRRLLDQNVRNTLIRQIGQEWKRISGFSTFDDWSFDTKLPAWTVLAETSNGRELLQLLRAPQNYSNEALRQAQAELEVLSSVTISRCQTVFLQTVVPEKYRKLKIDLASLLRYLGQQCGSDPNRWPEHPEIGAFIRAQYRDVFAPEVVRNLKDMDAATLKKTLLQLVKTDPDIGLRFLEL